MKTSRLMLAVLAGASLLLPSCATTHGVRWTYGHTSIWDPPDADSEAIALRAIAGAPVILGSVGWDLVTWPFQLAFGVWPMWGDSSTQMRLPEVKPQVTDAPPTEEPAPEDAPAEKKPADV